MTKNEFLRELENSLKWQLSKEDVNEVISDYSDIFDNGLKDGKSEADIANELGSPAIISRTILEDANNEYNSFTTKQNIKKDTSNLAPMSKRLGAYIIDTFLTSLIFALLFSPFSYSTSLTTGVEHITSASVDYINTIENEYKEKTTIGKNGEITKKEFYESGKRIFKGSEEEYKEFLNNKGIKLVDIREFETIKKGSFDFFYLTSIFPMTLLLMFFGFSNIITAFELWIFKGYTLGKWLVKIKVQRLDGKRITFWDSFLRDALIKSIGNSITSGILNIVSFIWGSATPEHKTVQDLATKTKVISLER